MPLQFAEGSEGAANAPTNEVEAGPPLRVVMVVTGFPDAGRPEAGIFSLRAAQELRSLTQLTVVHLRTWVPGRRFFSKGEVEGVPVLRLAFPLLPHAPLNIQVFARLGWRYVRPYVAGCAVIHSVGPDLGGAVGHAWARRSGARHVNQTITEIAPPQAQGSWLGSILGDDGQWEGKADAVACNSEALATAYRALYPQARNVRTVYRGVDLQRFRPEGPEDGPLPTGPGVRFLFLGGFPPYPSLRHRDNTKGGKTLCAAWQEAEAELAAAGASLLIAGPNGESDWTVGWRAALRYPERVYLAGPLNPASIASQIRGSDVVLVPSMQEGLPNVAVEAAACGRAVFGSTAGGTPEVVRHGETGLVIPAGDVTAWKDALIAYSRRLADVRTMGEAARRRAEERFDARKYGPTMAHLYRAVTVEPGRLV